MAQIDPNIAMGFRPIQIESPINQMAAISQLENARQQQQMNMLQMQEYARKAKEDQDLASQRNALAQIHSNLPPGVKIGSEQYLNLVASKAPRFLPDVMEQQTKREGLLAQRELREAETEKRQFELGQKKEELSRTKIKQAIADIAGFDDLESINADIDRKLASGELSQDQAAQIRSKLPADNAGVAAWQRQTLLSLLELKDRITAMRDEGKPIVVEGSLVSPTGRVIYQGDKKPVTVPAGSQLVNPNTGEVIFTAKDKPVTVAPGGQLVNPDTGEVIFTAKDKPVTVTPGGQLVDPSTGQVIFTAESADAKPVTVAPGGVVVNPKTGEVIYTAPAAPEKPESRTEAQKNYDAAIADGSFTGTFAQYLDQQRETEAEREYRKAKLPVSQGGSGFTGTFLDFKKLIAKANKIVVQTSAAPTLSASALDMNAERFLVDGTLPPGISKPNRDAIINRAAVIAKDKGMSVDRVAQLEVTANKSALAQLSKTETMVGAFEKNFIKNVKIVENLNNKRDSTGVPLLQKWINVGKKAVTGDPDLAALNIAIKAVVNEYGKIVSGSMGNQAVAVSEIKRMEDLLNSAQNPADVVAVLNVMKAETQNRMLGFKEQRAELTGAMRSSTAAPKAKSDVRSKADAILGK